ncbi:MAG TPA: Glu/Leu/Phe/Val dehydrogenase [Desulfobulbus sp.]|nr:Glu/Leu/Phe/Val dehydrogenase [Desulfobulbus sp.]
MRPLPEVIESSLRKRPELVLEYVDPLEGFRGWLAIDCLAHRLCAGGLRVQKGLTRECVENLARNMTLKMRIAGIRADGAKSGIDYDPCAPGRQEALFRFFRAMEPFLRQRYSMGPDLNTTMPELDKVAARLGIPSIKIAIAHAQGLDQEEFLRRIRILRQPAGFATLGRMRAGSGLAAACLGALEFLRIPAHRATVVIQGFGGLGAAASYFLHRCGVRIKAIADCEKSLCADPGQSLDIDELVAEGDHGLLPHDAGRGHYDRSARIFDIPCDIFIPAAVEQAVTVREAGTLQIRGLVCGANLAVTPEAEMVLHERGIVLVPDMVAGCGGSLSMDGLFGPRRQPDVEQVLESVATKMRAIVTRVLERSRRDDIVPRAAALVLCQETPIYPDTKPYGALDN